MSPFLWTVVSHVLTEALPEHLIQLVVVGRDQAHNPVERRG